MNLPGIILISVLIWWLGRSATDAGLYITKNKMNTLTLPPMWVFILCGLPMNKNVPTGVMDSNGLGIQLSCILFILIGFVIDGLNLNSGIYYVISLVICFAFGLFFSILASRVWPYANGTG